MSEKRGKDISRRGVLLTMAGAIMATVGGVTTPGSAREKLKRNKGEIKSRDYAKERQEELERYFSSENYRSVIARLRRTKSIYENNKGRDYSQHVPVEGKRTLIENANFDIFKPHLGFAPGKQVTVISDYWQTACVYNPDGSIKMMKDRETQEDLPVIFQVGTGKSIHPTELGLYEIDRKQDHTYASNVYPKATPEEKKQGKRDGGAPMPWAMWLSKVTKIGKNNLLDTKPYDGTAFHGRSSVQDDFSRVRQSHGCIGANNLIAEFVNKVSEGKNDRFGNPIGDGSLLLVVDKDTSKITSLNGTVNLDESERERRLKETKIDHNGDNTPVPKGVWGPTRVIRD